jgi:hypothetical protein
MYGSLAYTYSQEWQNELFEFLLIEYNNIY